MSDERKSKKANAENKINRRTLLEGTAIVAVGSVLPASPASAAETIVVSVGIEQMKVDGKTVFIEDEKLAYAVKNDPRSTVAVLRKQIPSLTVEQISLDREGRVIIKNERFAKEISSARAENRDVNTGCPCPIEVNTGILCSFG